MNEITFNPERTLTLRDLRQIVEQCDKLGFGDDAELRGRVGWGQKLQRLTVLAGTVIQQLPAPPAGPGALTSMGPPPVRPVSPDEPPKDYAG